jgi:hypothetical protein
VAALCGAVLAAGSLALATSCASSDKTGASGLDNQLCTSARCGDASGSAGKGGTGGSGGAKDAGSELPGLKDVETWDGPRASITGKVGTMKPPEFSPWESDWDPLPFPASLRIAVQEYDYSGSYDPAKGISLQGVPAVGGVDPPLALLVEDIDGKNAILPSMWPVNSIDNNAVWRIPVTSKPALEAIYSSVTPPVVIDATKAQLIFTVGVSTTGPSYYLPSAGAKLRRPDQAEAVIYDTSKPGWVRNDMSGATGPAGICIIANMEAAPYPGKTYPIVYSVSGATDSTKNFTVAAGATIRLFIIQ